MATSLGLTTLSVPLSLETPSISEKGVTIVTRADLSLGKLSVLKNQINQVRKRAVIISAPIGTINTTNWAAEDDRVDLLTLTELSRGNGLRSTTAGLAAESGTALEIPIRPLLVNTGLARSKILKMYREASRTAYTAGMSVVISSGATEPILLRSPRALQYICHLLGMEEGLAKKAVLEHPDMIVTDNLHRLSSEFVAPGIEVIKRSDE